MEKKLETPTGDAEPEITLQGLLGQAEVESDADAGSDYEEESDSESESESESESDSDSESESVSGSCPSENINDDSVSAVSLDSELASEDEPKPKPKPKPRAVPQALSSFLGSNSIATVPLKRPQVVMMDNDSDDSDEEFVDGGPQGSSSSARASSKRQTAEQRKRRNFDLMHMTGWEGAPREGCSIKFTVDFNQTAEEGGSLSDPGYTHSMMPFRTNPYERDEDFLEKLPHDLEDRRSFRNIADAAEIDLGMSSEEEELEDEGLTGEDGFIADSESVDGDADYRPKRRKSKRRKTSREETACDDVDDVDDDEESAFESQDERPPPRRERSKRRRKEVKRLYIDEVPDESYGGLGYSDGDSLSDDSDDGGAFDRTKQAAKRLSKVSVARDPAQRLLKSFF